MILELGEAYVVTPIRFETFGAIVELQDGSTSLLHLSQISDKYVKDPSEYLSIGNEYVAKAVQGVGNRPVQLSVKHLGLQSCFENPESDKDSKPTRKKPYKKPKIMRSPVSQNESKFYRKSLDDMIADAQASYNEKMKGKDRKHRRK